MRDLVSSSVPALDAHFFFCSDTMTLHACCRCPTVIFLTTSEKEVLQIKLPEVTKRGKVITKSELHQSVSPDQGNKIIKDFNEKIKSHRELEDIIFDEIKIVYKSPYVPTIKLLDVPGLAPSVMNNNVNKVANKICRKYSNDGKKFGTIHLFLVESAKSDTVTGLCEAVRNLSGTTILYTNIDKVSLRCMQFSQLSCCRARCLLLSYHVDANPSPTPPE